MKITEQQLRKLVRQQLREHEQYGRLSARRESEIFEAFVRKLEVLADEAKQFGLARTTFVSAANQAFLRAKK